jgi:hypothetical protein
LKGGRGGLVLFIGFVGPVNGENTYCCLHLYACKLGIIVDDALVAHVYEKFFVVSLDIYHSTLIATKPSDCLHNWRIDAQDSLN